MNEYLNVRRDFVLYDTICIGDDVPQQTYGWFKNFTEMANNDSPYSFFNQRQEGETGDVYTNMKKKAGLDWPCIFLSMGIRFVYPDPVNTAMFDGDRAAAKMFMDVLPEHMTVSLYLGGSDHKITVVKPAYAPSGYGSQGNQSGPTSSYSSIISKGAPLAGNRFLWVENPLEVPKDYSIEVRLNLSSKAKDILRALHDVKPIAFAGNPETNPNGVQLSNWAMIEVTLRGTRDTQQDGARHR